MWPGGGGGGFKMVDFVWRNMWIFYTNRAKRFTVVIEENTPQFALFEIFALWRKTTPPPHVCGQKVSFAEV